jgi:manganese/zinc/iron transport system permease protein
VSALLHDLLFDYTLRTVALGAALLGALAGGLGTFAVLRRQSLLGDAISHAALPGLALAFLLTGSRSTVVLALGAALAGWLATLLLAAVVGTTRVKEDTALGLLLSVFFGVGMVLLTFIQRRPDASQAGLDKFLFGQASALLAGDVRLIAAVAAVAALAVLLLWKELALLTFDRDLAAVSGLPVRALDLALATLLVAAIVVGLQTVGVVLVSALVVAPAAAARQWSDRLPLVVGLAALFGAASGLAGAVLSASAERLPTGPTVVLCLSAVTLVSLLLAPRRGLAWSALRDLTNRRRLRLEAVLEDLLRLAEQHPSHEHGHRERVLTAMRGGTVGVRRSLAELERRGLVARLAAGSWALTAEGVVEARRLITAVGERDR